jgi:hypothetical protein
MHSDDKANFQLDNVYRKKRPIQEQLKQKMRQGGGGFKDDDGQFDRESYNRAAKAETHDHATATGMNSASSTLSLSTSSMGKCMLSTRKKMASTMCTSGWMANKQLSEKDSKHERGQRGTA